MWLDATADTRFLGEGDALKMSFLIVSNNDNVKLHVRLLNHFIADTSSLNLR